MSLLNEVATEQEAVGEAVGKKKSNSEYQKKQRELAQKYGKIVLEFVKAHKDASAEVVEAAEWLGRERKAGGNGGSFGKPVIYQLFGDAPKAGATITGIQVYEKTGKGFQEMRQLMKKWAEKHNITVTFDEKSKAYKLESEVPAFNA